MSAISKPSCFLPNDCESIGASGAPIGPPSTRLGCTTIAATASAGTCVISSFLPAPAAPAGRLGMSWASAGAGKNAVSVRDAIAQTTDFKWASKGIEKLPSQQQTSCAYEGS